MSVSSAVSFMLGVKCQFRCGAVTNEGEWLYVLSKCGQI